MLFSPHINRDEISHFSPTQRCELVNLGILIGKSIKLDLLSADAPFGSTEIQFRKENPELIERITVEIKRGQEFLGRAVSEIRMGGTEIYPKGGIKAIVMSVDKIGYGDFNSRPFMTSWTVSKKIVSEAGPVVTETAEFEVTKVERGKSLAKSSEFFGVTFPPGTPVALNNSPLKYVWDGVWAVPMTQPLSSSKFLNTNNNKINLAYLVGGAVLLSLISVGIWILKSRSA
jgi:hypothetical protein